MVDDCTVVARLLQDDAGDLTLGQALGQVRDFDLEAQGFGATLDHGDGLREEVCVKHGLGGGLGLVGAAHQQHCFGNGGCFVEHRSVGDRQAGQVHDHGLEVQQCLETALGDFGLVRGVSRVPGRVFQDVAQDHRRGVGVGETLADHLGLHDILAGEHAEIGKNLGFGARGRQVQGLALADIGRNGRIDEFVEGGITKLGKHGVDVAALWANMAGDELSGRGHGHGELHWVIGVRARRTSCKFLPDPVAVT